MISAAVPSPAETNPALHSFPYYNYTSAQQRVPHFSPHAVPTVLPHSPSFFHQSSHRHRLRVVFTRRISSQPPLQSNTLSSGSTYVEQLEGDSVEDKNDGNSDLSFQESYNFDSSFESIELKRLESPVVEVKQLEELPEQWRRSRLAWLCKELPSHKQATFIRVLNAQRKWLRQEDATYVAVHFMRTRENEAAFRVYRWMTRQHWFRFDFALATKLADYLGKQRKYLKCREIFDDIINQGRVPCESTYHIMIVAYLSSPGETNLEEACNIYKQMIHLGGYKPRLSLQNSLFRALVTKPGSSCKHFLKEAEFIFHNLTTSQLEIHKDIYGGLIWLHSYQEVIDMDRIASLRAEMQLKGIEESKEILVSILRACAKEGNLEEAELTWMKLIGLENCPPAQAFVHRMEIYSKVGEPAKSLEIFRDMQEQLGSTSVVAFQKIIEVLCKAQTPEQAETVMSEFMDCGQKPLIPSFIDLMEMYFSLGLHEKLELTFFKCIEKCRPNKTIYNLYLDSLVQSGNLNKAEEVFSQMHSNIALGMNSRSCSILLRGYLSNEEYTKAAKIYELMCQKKYVIEEQLSEKLDYALSLSNKEVKQIRRPKLSLEQREILLGLFLGGLQTKSNDKRRKHAIHFQFNNRLQVHSILRRHIYDIYYEWLDDSDVPGDESEDIPWEFTTIYHSHFGFYAEQFWSNGLPVIPKLIHRWLSPQVLAYWYMYGGYRTSSGDILLRLRGSGEDAKRVVRAFNAKSFDCHVKRKGLVFWIGFLGGNAGCFWKLIEPFVIYDLRDLLVAGGKSSETMLGTKSINFDCNSDSEEMTSDLSDNERTNDCRS